VFFIPESCVLLLLFSAAKTTTISGVNSWLTVLRKCAPFGHGRKIKAELTVGLKKLPLFPTFSIIETKNVVRITSVVKKH